MISHENPKRKYFSWVNRCQIPHQMNIWPETANRNRAKECGRDERWRSEPGEKANHRFHEYRYRYILEAAMQFSYVNLSIYTSLSSVPSSSRCEHWVCPRQRRTCKYVLISMLFLHISLCRCLAFGNGAAQRCRRFHIYHCGIDFHNPYLNIYILDSLSSSSSPPPSSSSSTLAIDAQTCVYFWCAFHLQFLARRRHRLQAHSHCECVCLCLRLLWQNRRKGKFTQYQPVYFFWNFFSCGFFPIEWVVVLQHRRRQ